MDVNPYVYWMLQELLRSVQWQSNQIVKLQQQLEKLQEAMAHLQTGPRTNVEKIEYNFEQLKVERLDGTLIIGVTGTEGGTIDDLMVEGKSLEDIKVGGGTGAGVAGAGPSPAGGAEARIGGPPRQTGPELNERVGRYIREDVPALLEKQAEMRGIGLTGGDKERIVADLLRQAAERAELYLEQATANLPQGGTLPLDDIVGRIRDEVLLSLDGYIDWKGSETSGS